MKKIKLLLGVYADEVNAQNINGINIAKNIDKQRFEIHMFYVGEHEPNMIGVIFHKISKNIKKRNLERLLFYMTSFFDIYYFPRLGRAEYIYGLFFYKKRCIVTSIELESMFENKIKMHYLSKYSSSVIAINNMLQQNAKIKYGIQAYVLPLGADDVEQQREIHNSLVRVACIGTITQRKRPDLIMKLASSYPQIEFVFVGEGPLKKELENRKENLNLNNVCFKGQVSNKKVYEILGKCDLLLIASENEGQPKTSLEAGILGVPTCYIKTNYRIDHVINGVTGFEVSSYEEMFNVLQNLLDNFETYYQISSNVKVECQKYLWKNLIIKYEEYFEELYKKYQ